MSVDTHEDRQLGEVVERLAARYPTVAQAEIAAIVAEVHEHFARVHIREHVPLLVEHQVREELGSPTAGIPPIGGEPEHAG
ncbi:three-helix bundle dimerization domain-containing protein [Nocardia thailandica]|uniref:three-helix bundle dimerization domain-containing protein n=1 Tax=Nocardia thailandica TaxID=257275 RepID=UPI00030DD58F|nr:hypothetical protein [Nocardia thailandica]